MRFILVFISTIILSWLTGFILPWWNVVPAAFLIALVFPQPAFRGFICAFIAVFLLWFALALDIDIHNDHILSSRMAMLIFKRNLPYLVITVSAFTGALVAGLAALTACLLRKQNRRKAWR